MNIGLAGFVLTTITARFAYPAVSTEREAFWLIKSVPIHLKHYLWIKYFIYFLPLLILTEILIIATNILLKVTPFMMFLTVSTMFFMSFGIVALGMGMGAMYPDFKSENIAQVSTGFGGVLYMLVSSLFIGLVIVLEAGPVYMIFISEVRGVPISRLHWLFILASFLAVLAASCASVFSPLKLGIRALGRYE